MTYLDMDRIARLERDNRRLKLSFVLLMAVTFTLGFLKSQGPPIKSTDVNSIAFRRTDGTLVAELKVEDSNSPYNMTLRDARGTVRVSFLGFAGEYIPPFSSINIHDSGGQQRLSIVADDTSVGIALMGPDRSKQLSYSGA